MKHFITLIILLSIFFSSCEKDPIFPDPGLDAKLDVRDTIRRDTIDTYFLQMFIKAPNGVKHIEILDGLNYKELDKVTEYESQKFVDFKYPIDLKNLPDRDTTLNYIVKVIDKNLRSFNKAFSILVKKESWPTITMKGFNGTLGVTNPVFKLSVFFETGLNNLKRYSIIFEEDMISEKTFDTEVSEYKFEEIVSLKIEKGKEYVLKIELEDSEGNIEMEEMKVVLLEKKHPKKVMVYQYGKSSVNREFYFRYNKDYELDSINAILFATSTTGIYELPRTISFVFNENNQLNQLIELGETLAGPYENIYYYEYDSQHRLTKVHTGSDNQNLDIIVTSWHDNGEVKSYTRRNKPLSALDIPYMKISETETICAEGWLSASTSRTIVTSMSPISIPTYTGTVPLLFPTNPTQVADLALLLAYKYGPETEHTYRVNIGNDFEGYKPYNPLKQFTYITAKDGNLEKIIINNIHAVTGAATKFREYIFTY